MANDFKPQKGTLRNQDPLSTNKYQWQQWNHFKTLKKLYADKCLTIGSRIEE